MDFQQLINIIKDDLDLENILLVQKLDIILIPKENFNNDYSNIVLATAKVRFLEACKEMTGLKNIEIKLSENVEFEKKVLEEDLFIGLSEGLKEEINDIV